MSFPPSLKSGPLRSLLNWLIVIGLILLMALPRITALNEYLIVDEADRWLWAEDFVHALNRGDLAGTLIGHGYPGLVPVWAESIWVFIEAGRRSLSEGQWIGEPGLNLLFHEWDRPEFLFQQRLPIALSNTIIALTIVWAVWRLFGKRVALVSGLLIALDPFYLSDSRLNRAEGMITGLMTLSVLALIFYYRKRSFRFVFISGILGGLSLLTKIQALIILPAVALTGLLIYADDLKSIWQKAKDGRAENRSLKFGIQSLSGVIWFGAGWIIAVCLTWLIVWPAMWVVPGQSLAEVYDYATHMSGAEGANVFFLGQNYQDADPGFLFYPMVFLMRITPLALLGLIGAAIAGVQARVGRRPNTLLSTGDQSTEDESSQAGSHDLFSLKGSSILIIYVLVYALAISVGSHKQDRYLMPAFLSLDILAAIGLVYLWIQFKAKFQASSFGSRLTYLTTLEWVLFAGLVIVQLATVLPHHPYYFSYFNPLFGGGRTAVQTLRIGWGEGMDQVGAYLAAKPNSQDLVVSSRFTHNMLGFKGELISLNPGGRWTRADYIVLYIQQVQRRLEPSPGFIDYFQARSPEKVITLGGIDYAWIYPIPFTNSANPQVSVIPGQAALLGYSWEGGNEQSQGAREDRSINSESSVFAPRIRLFWENLGMSNEWQLLARLTGSNAETEWAVCLPDSAFISQAQATGEFVESLCVPSLANLTPGNYSVEFGLTLKNSIVQSEGNQSIETFLFPEGWNAARLSATGEIVDTPAIERFEAIVDAAVPVTAQRLDRIYDDRLRLVAYQIEPPQPKPGEALELTLYWQPIREVKELVTSSSNATSWRTDYWQSEKNVRNPIRLVVQLADSRSISLGRIDAEPPIEEWLVGEVVATRHKFELARELVAPLAAQVEVSLVNEAEVVVRVTNLAGTVLEAAIARFTIAPETWPDLNDQARIPRLEEVEAVWQSNIALRGYEVSPEKAHPGEPLQVSLFWEARQSVADNYVGFVHLVDETGQIKTQNDSLPRAGAYPTPWWQSNTVVEDVRTLALPEDLPAGIYQLVVGLYRFQDGVRLPLMDNSDSVVIGTIQVR